VITRRRFTAGSVVAGLFAATGIQGSVGPTVPWRNWSGGRIAQPAGRIAPATEEELIDWLRASEGPLRPVGAGHSFSALVPTEGYLLVLDKLSGLLAHDPERLRATFGAGTRLSDMGAPLEAIGQGSLNLPDIDRQTLAGAISTATHGTGIGFHSLSGAVTALRLITVAGEVLDLTAANDPDRFAAACVSVGALGVITRVEMQNRAAYRLKLRSWPQRTEEVLETFEASALEHRHFEMFPFTHSDYATVLAIDETDEPVNNPPPSPEEEAAFAEAIAALLEVAPQDRRPLVNAIAEQIEPSEAVDVSYRILTNVRNDRFNEMEYAVPREAGAECLREVLATIADNAIDVVFPLEYRYVQGDDLWLSMDEGGDRAAISVHRTATEDYRPLFETVEPIFWKYGGRPHWGKVHSLGYAELSRLYPKFDDFCALRAELDPHGRLLNEHLRSLFAA
jgi:FAD-linked oxidoreductase